MSWGLKIHFAVAATLRLLLICYGRIHDVVFEVRFTDIDYYVFTDAARYVSVGQSPYDRSTYRYTPLLAWLLTPTIFSNVFEFGKILFTLFDLASALLTYGIVRRDTRNESIAKISACVVLYNPLNAVVSARGNAESILSTIVLSILYLLGNNRSAGDRLIGYRKWIAASILHGLAVHLKIYPLIYLPSIFFYSAAISAPIDKSIGSIIRKLLINYRGYLYGLLCSIAFVSLTCICYEIYGRQFLDESLLYHISRRDIKHNFSPYFYVLYLTENRTDWAWIGSLAFVPQLISTLWFSWRYRDDLSFGWFASTFAFVALNKVCTSQYFVWYLTLAPLIWYKIKMPIRFACKLLLIWMAAQAVWLTAAYLLEFKGWNAFFQVWMASVLFFLVNCYVLASCVRAYEKNETISDKKKD